MAGILGRALAGFGAGLQQKAKFDWEALRDESRLQFQAEMNRIEREYRTDERIAGHDFQSTESQKSRDDQAAENERTRAAATLASSEEREFRSGERVASQAFQGTENDKTREAAAAERAAARKDMVDVLDDSGNVVGQRDRNTNTYVPIREFKDQERYVDIVDKDGNIIGQKEVSSGKKTPFQARNEFGEPYRPSLPAENYVPKIVDVRTEDELKALPSGTRYRLPNGRMGTRK